MDALKPVLQRINALLQNFESVEAKSQAVPDQAHLKTKIEADTQILLKQLLEDSDLSPSSAYHSNQTLGNFPQLAALKELDPDDKTLPLRQNVQQAIDYIREPLVENQIKPELVEEVIDTHVTIPLRNYLTEETAAQQIAAEVEQMVSKRAELDLQHQAHLQDAATRNDRQSAKLEYYERREQFFLQSLQTLERQVLKDKQTLGTLATADTPELAAHLQSLAHLSSQCNRLHHTVQHKACVYAPSPPQLDEKLTQLKELQAAMGTEAEVLQHKLAEIEGCGAAILSEVPGFVHPKDDLSRRLAATLATKREQLQTIYLKYLSVPVSNSDLSSSSGQDSEASEAIPKRVIESPYKIRRRLKKLSTQLGSPDAPKSPQGCADTGTPQPTPQQLNRARSLKRAMATRGAPMRSKRHKSQ
eukprot:NODE_1778_length_1385_cov_22.797297_g659_i1.p1 GENE.NODE_1778_length_1385_cov_22.797297_g659_i1~~NODE_1778_length_1385_cov_22.797297_g659_i1.p1  ORF type:complete len:416 (-),score=109.41 NODE_1778_length_1385_cov_22.797297_g659_i1:138-1385(-)